ncbi:MAG: aldose epimerase family protein [Microthrixaceae bacterium]
MTNGISASVRRVRGSDLAVLEVGPRRLEVLSLGAHLIGLWSPDREGRVDNVVVSMRDVEGSPDVDAYRDPARNPYLGSIVGRYANRIAGSAMVLDGATHRLVSNEGPNQLHGGPGGFSTREWDLDVATGDRGARVELHLVSPDGDQGFPGQLDVAVTYRLDLDGTMSIQMSATTDEATVVNLTNHTYWNLAGTTNAVDATVADHELSVAADRVVEVDADLLPTGRLVPVDAMGMGLRTPVRVGDLLEVPAFAATGGVDHCWVLDAAAVDRPRITLSDPSSGRRIRVGTDQPGVQVYTANHGAGPLPRHGAVCLETQHLPDSPNQPAFPSPVIRPGQVYAHSHVVRLDAAGSTAQP